MTDRSRATEDHPPTISEFYELLVQATNIAEEMELPYVGDLLMRAEDETKRLLESSHRSLRTVLREKNACGN